MQYPTRTIAALTLAGGAIFATAVHAQKSHDALADWYLRGTWAVDCRRPASGENPYQSYETDATGRSWIWLWFKSDDARQRSEVINPHVIEGGLLRYTHRSVETNGGSYDVTLGKVGDRKRSVRSVSDDGRVLIADGHFTASKKPTPLFEKCSADNS